MSLGLIVAPSAILSNLISEKNISFTMNATAPFESDPTQRKKAVHVKVCMSVRAPFKEVFFHLSSLNQGPKSKTFVFQRRTESWVCPYFSICVAWALDPIKITGRRCFVRNFLCLTLSLVPSQLLLGSGRAKLLRSVLFLLQKQTKNAPVRRHLPVLGAVLCAPSHHASG